MDGLDLSYQEWAGVGLVHVRKPFREVLEVEISGHAPAEPMLLQQGASLCGLICVKSVSLHSSHPGTQYILTTETKFSTSWFPFRLSPHHLSFSLSLRCFHSFRCSFEFTSIAHRSLRFNTLSPPSYTSKSPYRVFQSSYPVRSCLLSNLLSHSLYTFKSSCPVRYNCLMVFLETSNNVYRLLKVFVAIYFLINVHFTRKN